MKAIEADSGCVIMAIIFKNDTNLRLPAMRLLPSFLCLFSGLVQQTLSDESPAPSASPTRLDAPIVIGEFVPPAAVPPKEVPPMQIESSVTKRFDGKRITVLRGEPSTLPDISRPVAPQLPTPEELSARESLSASQPKTIYIQMGATVYDHRVSIVHWRHPEHSETAYEAVVGLDFGLFANVTNFTHKEIPHHVLLMHSHIPAEAIERWKGNGLEVPQIEPGAYRLTDGDSTDSVGMAPFIALMDLYAAEKDQLLAANTARLKYLAEAEAWRKANPPPVEPTQRTFWLRPHRGSRYLQPEGGAR